MKRLLAAPRRMFAVGALAAVAVVATSYGYAAVTADNQTYTGCLQSGSLTNIAVGETPLKICPKNAAQISWNQTGPPGTPGSSGTNGTNGTNGVSVTSETEAAGAHCADGGSKFTAVNSANGWELHDTYACNGAKGEKGDPGGSSLAALDGSPCTTFSGEASTVRVTVGQSGIVNVRCNVLEDVSATFTGSGLMNQISIRDSQAPEINVVCRDATECSGEFAQGHDVSVQFNAFNQNFEYKCPQDPTTTLATANFINFNLTVYTGACNTPLGLVAGGYSVTGTFLDD